MDIKELAKGKILGLPSPVVLVAVSAAAVYGVVKLKPASPSPAADTTGTASDVTTAGDGGDTSQPVFTATPTIIQPSGPNTSVSATPGPDTDDLWKRRAIAWLIANGYTLDVATSAINKYLNGDVLTAVEGTARDKAVAQFGIPPETVPDTSTIAAPSKPGYSGPAAKQGTPPCNHIVRGTSDDTPGELALLYYGVSGQGSGTITLIRSWNPGLHEPYPKGTSVRIPALVAPKYYVATSATHTLYQIAQKNGTTAAHVAALNPGTTFPVKVGAHVRVR